ncbi:two-component system, NarL family, sensor histidine kinase LiaS [Thermoflexales bacterium]|nr:two-component system, NarL family, sensor histidine kinase LiaS [Thermoflexales bacterium]
MTAREEANERRTSAELEALFEATMTITAELAIDRVLQRIADLARSLVSARYAALGVPTASGSGLEKFITSGMTAEAVRRIGHLPEGKGLLGLLLREPKPIRVRRLEDDPRSTGVCNGHPTMQSFLGVPIIFKGRLLGNLYLTDKIGAAEFSEQDEHLITMLAAQAAIAIENANLYKQVQRLAVLEERERIAMDLHDGIIQSIYAVGLMLEYAGLTFDESPEQARKQLQDSISGLNEVIRDIRNYILDLRPQRFQNKNLSAGLIDLVRAFKANTLITVDVQTADRADADLTTDQSTGLFHITQEALANIAKHARARTVTMNLRREGPLVILTIQDDGRGFDTSTVKAYTGHGLQNMRERARAMGAQLHLESIAGQGTLLEVRLPVTIVR